MTQKIIEAPVFRCRNPLTAADFERLAITGTSGAFREKVINAGFDPSYDVFWGTTIVCEGGQVTNSRPVKVGTIKKMSLDIRTVWEDCEYDGELTVDEHDASLYGSMNGFMTSSWCDQIPWRAKLKINGAWCTVKKPKLADYHLTDLVFRMNSQCESSTKVKCLITVAKYSLAEIRNEPDGGSRFYPSIRIGEIKARLFPLEEPHHQFGCGVQPMILVEDVNLDAEGELDYSDAIWPVSQAVKDRQAQLLQSAIMANVHLTGTIWKEKVDKRDFPRRVSSLAWPDPRREDEESEAELSDCSGVFTIQYSLGLRGRVSLAEVSLL